MVERDGSPLLKEALAHGGLAAAIDFHNLQAELMLSGTVLWASGLISCLTDSRAGFLMNQSAGVQCSDESPWASVLDVIIHVTICSLSYSLTFTLTLAHSRLLSLADCRDDGYAAA